MNAQEAQNVLQKMLGAEWQSIIPNMIATCKDHIDNFNPGNGPPPGNRGPPENGQQGPHSHRGGPMQNCNMAKEKLFHCISGQILLNCPDSLWNNGKN